MARFAWPRAGCVNPGTEGSSSQVGRSSWGPRKSSPSRQRFAASSWPTIPRSALRTHVFVSVPRFAQHTQLTAHTRHTPAVGPPFMKAVKEACSIAHTAERGISLEQLQRLVRFISKMADRWFETYGANAGSRLTFGTFNLYHANHWIIKPATQGYHEQNGCSLVEVMALDPHVQKPRWFVSHAWIDARQGPSTQVYRFGLSMVTETSAGWGYHECFAYVPGFDAGLTRTLHRHRQRHRHRHRHRHTHTHADTPRRVNRTPPRRANL